LPPRFQWRRANACTLKAELIWPHTTLRNHPAIRTVKFEQQSA
jgi:hypothetical protein